MKVYYNMEPQKITYEMLPTGTAHVMLRKDIKQEKMTYQNGETNEEKQVWTADEVELFTTATLEEVTAQFDSLILDGKKPTNEERLSALEDAVSALMGGDD